MTNPGNNSPLGGNELRILREAVASLHDSLMVTRRDGTIVFVNPAFERTTGWSAQEAVGNTPRILKSGAHPAEFYRDLWGVILGGGTWRGTILNKRRDGSVYPQELVITPVPGTDDRPSHFIATGRDVSERLQNAQETIARQEISEQVLESLGDVSFLVDIASKRFLYISPMYDRVVGYPASEVLADTSALLKPVHPDDVAKVRAMMEQPTYTGDVEIAYRIVRPDGTVRQLASRAWLVRDVRGEPARFAGTLRDVTEMRAKEAELARNADQFRQSQKMEAVGRLAGGVAHDFNNMLTAILGYGELVADELGDNARLRANVDEILKAGNRAAELTKRLLAFSRKQMLAPESLDLERTVRDLEGMMRRMIGEDIRLEVRAEAGTPAVFADKGQVEQVLMNLAVNARDAMPQGGTLRVAISTAAFATAAEAAERGVPAAGRFVRVSVTDTGCGMTDEVKAHLFEPFFTTKEPGRGTGLGLATVHGILHQSGGGMAVTSAPGKGSTFDAYLPVSDETPREAAPAKPGTRRMYRGTETILVAEDEDLVRGLVVETLRGAGYRVLVAKDGHEAVELAGREQGPIRLLLSDVVMPGMGGLETARAVMQSRPGTKVLFMTGYAEEETAEEVMAQPGTELIRKPFSPKMLLERIEELLAGK